MIPPYWSVSMTLGGPNGLVHKSCRPRSRSSDDLLDTILACVYLVHVSMICCHGSFLEDNVAADEPEDTDDECESTK
eukprot:12899107-Prorocentrum_lima.AAC.1